MSRPLPRLLLAGVLGLALAGCGSQNEDAVTVAVIGKTAPSLTDPASVPMAEPSRVLAASVAQGLVRFDAHGQIEPGLAERWNVSDDGLSYIFRIAATDLPDGRAVNARDAAKILNRQLRTASDNPLKDALGAVSENVAMTDRVIEIRLRAPRPNLLQLLAQPELGIVRQGQGTGPFQRDPKQAVPGSITLTRTVRVVDDADRVEHIRLRSADAAHAIRQFRDKETELVLGGTFVDLPLARSQDRALRSSLHFDPVAGLFGLAPARSGGPLADRDMRDRLNRAINRDAASCAVATALCSRLQAWLRTAHLSP
jgi:peptide/nickel transport system substrate-binding protein